MGALDHQLGIVDEVTYGTPVTVTKFYEYNSESISETEGRTEGDPLRSGTFVQRNDRFTPYFAGAAGTVQLDVMTKGFGYWLKHMLGAVATTGPAETTVFTHSGTVNELIGDMFSLQVNRPFHPAGTNQPFTYSGGKITKWTLSNSVDGNLVCDLDVDFQTVSDAIALATASYPTSMENLTWAGGVVTIGGSAFDITEFSCSWDNAYNVDRRFIRANTLKKEPTNGRRMGEFSMSADFSDLTQRARAHSATRAGALAQIIATWNGPTLLGSTLFPQLKLTIPAARFDSWTGATEGPTGISQTLSGVVRWTGTGSPITLDYASADTTP